MGKKKKTARTEKVIQDAELDIEQSRIKSMEKVASTILENASNASKRGLDVLKSSSKNGYPGADEKPETEPIEKVASDQLAVTAKTSGVPSNVDTEKNKTKSASKVSFPDAKKITKKKDKKTKKVTSKTSEEEKTETGSIEKAASVQLPKTATTSGILVVPEEKTSRSETQGMGSMSRVTFSKTRTNMDENKSKENVDSSEQNALTEKPTHTKGDKKKKPKSKKKIKSDTPRSNSSAAVTPTDSGAESGGKEKKTMRRMKQASVVSGQSTDSKIQMQEQELSVKELTKSKSNVSPSIAKSSSVRHGTFDSATKVQTARSDGEVKRKREVVKGKSSVTKVSKSQVSVDEYVSDSTASSEELILEKKKSKAKRERKNAKNKKEPKRKKTSPTTAESVSGDTLTTEEKTGKKKGKKEKKAEIVIDAEKAKKKEEEEDEDAFIAQIIKQKREQLTAAPKSVSSKQDITSQTTEEPTPRRGKKAPKKKLSKKEKARIAAETAEKIRMEAEHEAAMQAERERVRMEQERRAAIEKEQIETVEQRVREDQLERSEEYIDEVGEYNRELMKKERTEMEWQLYIECGKLPNPSLCDKMNTYLHLWEKNIDCTTITDAAERTRDVLKLLNDLEDLIDNADEPDNGTIENWKWVRQLFRERQSETLDVATHRLLRNVEKNLHRIDIPTADFNFNDENVNLSIWLRVQLPVPLPNPRRPPKTRIDVSFPDVNLQMLLPTIIDCENMAIRVMYLKYDHLSDLCSSFYLPPLPTHLTLGLREMVKTEWRVRLKYKYDHRDKKPKPTDVADVTSESAAVLREEKNLESVVAPEEPLDFGPDEEIPVVPYKKLEPTSSEYAVAVEDRDYMRTRKALLINTPENFLNLRRYIILGGVFHLNALYQPPQPQDFVTIDMTITSLYLPKRIEHVPFSVTFIPPPPTEPGVRKLPEEIEEEMKRVEEELDKLIMVTLAWPQHVIFLELPLVVQWDEEERSWSKENVHDLKHNEEKCVLTFRTGSFGIFGLGTLRYANLPYQAWEMRPEADGSVTVNITASILVLEFNVKKGLICISQLQNSPNNALQDIVGQYFKFYFLKKIMKEAGLDIFPEQDAFCYVEGNCEKSWPMEKHLYFNMAGMSNSFNFAWSRWNLTAGRRNIVLQLREYFPNKSKQKSHSMLLVTPLRATLVDCTEVSQVFSANDIGDSSAKMSSDLYNLMKTTSGIAVRKNVQNIPKENVFVLSELLISSRVLSFS